MSDDWFEYAYFLTESETLSAELMRTCKVWIGFYGLWERDRRDLHININNQYADVLQSTKS